MFNGPPKVEVATLPLIFPVTESCPTVVVPSPNIPVVVGVPKKSGAEPAEPKRVFARPADVTPIAEAVFPKRTPFAVKVEAPVPPLATVKSVSMVSPPFIVDPP